MFNKKDVWKILAEYDYPAKSGLDFRNEFTFIVGVVLSAQARDAFINTQTPALFDVADNAKSMVELGVDGIAGYIQKIGLWRNKANHIFNLSKKILEFLEIKKNGNEKAWYDSFFEKKFVDDDLKLYGDIISKEGLPSFRLGLTQLAGVGRKGANVFLNVIFEAPAFPVDTHVIKVGNRIGLYNTKNPYEIEEYLKENVPHQFVKIASHYLVWHGRHVCLARKPKCGECKLKEICNFAALVP